MSMPRLLTLILSACLGLVWAGCSSAPRFSGVNLELESIERRGDGTVTATVRILNGSVVAYNFSRVRHDIYLDGRQVGTLTVSKPTGVPANNTALQTGTVDLKPGANLAAGPAAYRLKSRVLILLYGERTESVALEGGGKVVVK